MIKTKSKHFLIGILFVALIGFLTFAASILLMVASFKTYHSSDANSQHYENKMFTFKSKHFNRNRSVQTTLETAATTLAAVTQCGRRYESSIFLQKKRFVRIIGGREVLPNNNYPWVIIFTLNN